MRNILFLAVITLAAAGLRADQVVLKNGDRISGKILQSSAEELVMKTEFLGEVKIKWAAITSIDSDQTLYVTSQNDQTLVGPVKTEDGKLEVETKESGTVAVPKEVVTAVRSQEAHEAYAAEIERLRNPRLLDFWKGYVDSSIASAQGNANTFTWANAAEAVRATQRDKISANFVSIFTRAKSPDGITQTTAKAIRGGTRYDINFSPKMFGFGGLTLEYDQFQQLDLRTVLLGGMGYHVIATKPTTLDLFAGGAYNNEFFTTLTRRSAELTFGDEFSHSFNDKLLVTQRLAVYPNISNTGQYRMQFDMGIVTRLSNLLNWQITFSDRYQSNPVPGVKTNDLLISTGVRLTFAQGNK